MECQGGQSAGRAGGGADSRTGGRTAAKPAGEPGRGRRPPAAGPAAKPAEGEGQMPERPLNATAASLLGFLHQGPLTGWDLVQTAEREIGDFWSLTRSQVYRELAAMAEAGRVEAGERGPRDRRPYGLTEAGGPAF